MPATPARSGPMPWARKRLATIPAMLLGTSTLTGAIASSALIPATTSRSISSEGLPYAVVTTLDVN